MSFLGGRTSAAHYSRTLTSQLYKFMLVILQTNLRKKKIHSYLLMINDYYMQSNTKTRCKEFFYEVLLAQHPSMRKKLHSPDYGFIILNGHSLSFTELWG